MHFCPPCAICCTVCAAKQPQTELNCAFGDPALDTPSPFALNRLLAGGTVTIKRRPQEEPSLCDHTHADDGWHEFDGTWHSGYLAEDDASLAKELWFLVKHEFIKATYNVTSEETLTLRIYLIPVDLKGVKGRLHHKNRGGSVLSSARRNLQKLLSKLSRSKDQWYGHTYGDTSSSETLVYTVPDRRTLAEIYSNLPSPQVDSSDPCCESVTRLLDYDDDLEGLGFRSTLYQYQRRSIAAMITRELDPRAVPDPLHVPLSTVNGKEFYFEPRSMEAMIECGYVEPTRGGLLCEELGTGKTVMVLGLILSTLNQLPSLPDTTSEPPVILTPLALKTFPSGPYASARQSIFRSHFRTNTSSPRVPPLTDLLLHSARTQPPPVVPNPRTPKGRNLYEKRLELESRFEMTPLNESLQRNIPFYVHPPEETNDPRSFRRSRQSLDARIMYLSAASLVVVPPNLLSQWHREVNKHCEQPLRVLILRSGTKMPSAKALAIEYDIILMTYNRYTAEAVHKDTSTLHSLPFCTCPDIPGSRVPDCKCPTPTGVSPLLQVRWKRLVIDEGHVSASLSTNLTPFTKLLSVERRWIVTGTPTTNLLGLNLGKNTISEVITDGSKEQSSYEEDYLEGDSENDTLSPQSPSGSSLPPQEFKQRVWNKYDRADLAKLDNMITHFIAVPHFIANPKLLSTHLRDPLMDKEGPRPGSIQVLTQLMEMIMIRHRIEDVEEDITLPPVVHEAILLDLDPIVAKSYNALQATIAINAIDSQRTDQDYLFHPRNTEFLQLTVKNLSQLMFWSVDETFYNVDQLVQNAQTTIDRAMSRNMPPEDIQLVNEAFRHIQLAAADPLWRRIQTHEDVPYRVYEMPRRIFNAWTRVPGFDTSRDPTLVGLLHADRLLKLQGYIISRPLVTEALIIEQGAEVTKTDMELRKAFEESYKRNKNKHSRKYMHSNAKPGAAAVAADNTEVHAGFMVENAAKKAAAPDTLKEMRKELDQSLAKLERDDEGESAEGEAAPAGVDSNTGSVPSVLVRSSVLAGVAVGSSASSKLNYIINEVMTHSANEKILIFSDSELTLAHVAEALQLIQVKFLRFTTQIQPQVREQLVLTFETSETYRVFLMELKHGARGLNLISASRVIFCEPVWQADVESQAIKRAHRIGQTRSITVKTLAIRGTAEENIVERRNLFKGSHDKIPKLIEESGMRHFIANPKFLVHESERLPNVEFRLIPCPRQPSTHTPSKSLRVEVPGLPPPSPGPASSSSEKRVFVEEPMDNSNNPVERADRSPPQKKQRVVHFG